MPLSRTAWLALGIPLAILVALQLVPYGHDRSHPPAGASPAWDSPRTLELAKRACFDCHSNETRWPWYASIAPASWRIQSHVREGREHLNFSAFDPSVEKVAEAADEAGEAVRKGEMPPWDYLLAHPEARLTAEEKAALIAGLDATFAGAGGRRGSRASGAAAATGPRGRAGHEAAREGNDDDEPGEHDEHDEHGRGRQRSGR
uniref:Cytochrome C n=1 Tax=Eiseniibacteriota bacterium TaxID=2212470 RepID=A0A832I730_UNCEI